MSWALQVASFIVLVDQLTLTTLMELVSHMVPLANTSGPSLLVFKNGQLITHMKHVPVKLGALVEAVFLHLWARITSVSQA